MRRFVLTLILIMQAPYLIAGTQCTYSTYKWNTIERKVVGFERVSKSYEELSENEVDNLTGCTICEEDQREILISGIKSFKVCKFLADDIEDVLLRSIAKGQKIKEIIGYRVGMTKGEADKAGNRTQFSFHSFGVAIDVNSAFNGLYDECIVFDSHCRLIKGGNWVEKSPYSLKPDSYLVEAMKEKGFKWGGEIEGKQKDFMHFSLTGY